MSGYKEIVKAIKAVRAQIRWKPNSAMHHLQKRKSRGHLPANATLKDYENIILKVLQNKSAEVYHYWYNRMPYVTVVSAIENKHWLVMFSYDGILESCFVLERPERYLDKPGFERIGFLGEVYNEL